MQKTPSFFSPCTNIHAHFFLFIFFKKKGILACIDKHVVAPHLEGGAR
jgi:hypothetical protein